MAVIEKIKVGIIEDDAIIRKNLVKFLGFHDDLEVITIASSVEEFIQKKLSIDVLLLDIGLPGMTGLDGIPEIKKLHTNLDIIMITAFDDEDRILKALCLGACSYLSKTSRMTEIYQTIKTVSAGGSYMSPNIARKITQYFVRGRVSEATILSKRQKEILEKLVDGKSYKMIANELFVSLDTVKSHVKSLYKVLHVNNKAAAIKMYLEGEIR